MKKILGVIILFSLTAFAQSISVKSIKQINSTDDGKFFHPVFSSDGSKILMTSENYKGLWYYDLNNEEIVKLNDYLGAGYEPVFSSNGEKVIFRKDDYADKKKMSSIMSQDLQTKSFATISERGRDLSTPKLLKNGYLVYTQANSVKAVSADLQSSVNSIPYNDAVAYIGNTKIVLIRNGKKEILAPLGNENYIWPSVSPDNTKLLFTAAGKGTFVSDLEGNILYEIGTARAPQWSPDSKWIIYMVDEDDGEKYTASDIFISSLDGAEKFQLTDTDNEIEMYPTWSSAGNKVAFNTTEGKIYLLELNID